VQSHVSHLKLIILTNLTKFYTSGNTSGSHWTSCPPHSHPGPSRVDCVCVCVCVCVTSDLAVGGVQQGVQVLQWRRRFVFEAGQQAALDGSELDRPLRQQVLVLLSTDTQLHTHTHTRQLPVYLFSLPLQIHRGNRVLGVYLEVVVHRQEVVLQGRRSGDALLEVLDSQFGEVPVEPLDQLLHHQPHILEDVTLDTVPL